MPCPCSTAGHSGWTLRRIYCGSACLAFRMDGFLEGCVSSLAGHVLAALLALLFSLSVARATIGLHVYLCMLENICWDIWQLWLVFGFLVSLNSYMGHTLQNSGLQAPSCGSEKSSHSVFQHDLVFASPEGAGSVQIFYDHAGLISLPGVGS